MKKKTFCWLDYSVSSIMSQHSNSKNVRPITVRETYDHPFWNPKLPVDGPLTTFYLL